MAYAEDLKSSARKGLWVRVPPSLLMKKKIKKQYRRAIEDVLKEIWLDTLTSQKPDAYYVLERLERRIKALLNNDKE